MPSDFACDPQLNMLLSRGRPPPGFHQTTKLHLDSSRPPNYTWTPADHTFPPADLHLSRGGPPLFSDQPPAGLRRNHTIFPAGHHMAPIDPHLGPSFLVLIGLPIPRPGLSDPARIPLRACLPVHEWFNSVLLDGCVACSEHDAYLPPVRTCYKYGYGFIRRQ